MVITFGLSEFITARPFGWPAGLASILVISFFVTLFQIVIYKKMTDQSKLKEIKQRQKKLQQELTHTKDTQRLKQLQEEMLELMHESMKENFKPLLVTFLPLIVVFIWLRKAYTDAGVGNIINWNVNLPVVGTGGGWLFCYILFSTIFSMILRKLFRVH